MNTLLSFEIPIVACLLAASVTLWAGPPEACQWRESSAQNCGVKELPCGNGIRVRVSPGGGILTSKDGSEWAEAQLGICTFVRSVTFGQGLIVAVGGSYVDVPGAILTSRDGVTWVRRHAINKVNLHDVAYGDGIFVATGDSGTILTSTNGTKWKAQCSGTSASLAGIAYGKGVFVAVGEDGTLLTSPDAIHWGSQRSSVSVYLGKVFYRNGAFCAIGHGTIVSSADGRRWHSTNVELAVALSQTNSVIRAK